MGSPLPSLGMAAGATEGLETYLTRRLEMQKQAELERQARSHESFLQRQLEQQAADRAATLEAHKADLSDRNKDREEGRRIQRVNISLARPIGSEVSPEEMAYDTKELGIPGSYFDTKAGKYQGMSGDDASEPIVGPEIHRFRGKEADLLKANKDQENEAYRASLLEDKDKDREMRLTIAQLMAATRQSGNDLAKQVRVMNVKYPDGTYHSVLVNGNGDTIYDGLSQPPGGMKMKEADLGALGKQINDTLQAGDRTQWKGVGPLKSPIAGALKTYFGKGSDAQDIFRSTIDSIKADVAHEKYGSAFTATERGMLGKFAPSSGMNGFAIRNKLRAMQYMIGRRMAELASGRKLDTDVTSLDQLMQEAETQQNGRAAGGSPAAAKPQVAGYTIEEVQ